MLILVLGANSSGKSLYAERLAVSLHRETLHYIATMIPYADSGAQRVAKHQRQRAGLGFLTQELPRQIENALVEKGDTVLLEDLSNLLANHLFADGTSQEQAQSIRASVGTDVLLLAQRVAHLIVVSISGLELLPDYDLPTQIYMEALNALNAELSVHAELVIELVDGRAELRKGELPL